MTYPTYLKEKARSLRRDPGMTIDELSERLSLSRTTIYYWVRDISIERSPATTWSEKARRKGNRAMQEKYLRIREIAYNNARISFHGWSALDPTFRDFICMYLGEGYKRNRNKVSICNSDPVVVELAHRWLHRLSDNRISCSLQHHADQDVEVLKGFWGNRLGVKPDSIRVQRKSNSGSLASRTWRSRFGVLTVAVGDTALRARIDGWMHELQRAWLDSERSGV